MLCNIEDPIQVARKIKGILIIQELLETRPIITAGYTCVIHIHCTQDEVIFLKLLGK